MEELATYVVRDGALSAHDAVGWIVRLCDTLRALHLRRTAHGRISARAIRIAAPSCRARGELLEPTRACADPTCMSPARTAGASPSPADDTWAVGVTLYRMLTGSEPFAGTTPAAVRSCQLSMRPRPLADFDVDDDNLQMILDLVFAREESGRLTKLGDLRLLLVGWRPQLAKLPLLTFGKAHEAAGVETLDDELAPTAQWQLEGQDLRSELDDAVQQALSTLAPAPDESSSTDDAPSAVGEAPNVDLEESREVFVDVDTGLDIIEQVAAPSLPPPPGAPPQLSSAAPEQNGSSPPSTRSSSQTTSSTPDEPSGGATPLPSGSWTPDPVTGPTPMPSSDASPDPSVSISLITADSSAPHAAAPAEALPLQPPPQPPHGVEPAGGKSRFNFGLLALGLLCVMIGALAALLVFRNPSFGNRFVDGLVPTGNDTPDSSASATTAATTTATTETTAATTTATASSATSATATAEATTSADSAPTPSASGAPSSGDAELAACVAPLFAADTFSVSEPRLSFLCTESNPASAARKLRDQIVHSGGGMTHTTTGMREWATMGWYSLAAYAIARDRCCGTPAPLVIKMSMRQCKLDERLVAFAEAANGPNGRDAEAKLRKATTAMLCVTRAGGASMFGMHRGPNRSSLLRFRKTVYMRARKLAKAAH